jgi:DNA replication and repair protein RecF
MVYETLPVWDAQLCQYGAILARFRADYLEKLAPLAEAEHSRLTDGQEVLKISAGKKYKGTQEELEKRLFDEMANNYDRDIRLGFTGSGPHRDDIDILIDEKDAKNYASQGQTRTAALAIKLAEVEIFRETGGEYPILILDDVMSELDLPRRKKLAESTKKEGLQTILTCTHAERVLYGREAVKIKIEGGKIKS